MRRSAKLLSVLIAVSLCLTMNGATFAACTVRSEDGGTAPVSASPAPEPSGSPEPSEAPAPDPAPPQEDTKDPEPAVTDTATLSPSDHESLTSRPGPDADIFVGTEVTDASDVSLDETVDGSGYTSVYASGPDADVHVTGSVDLLDSSEGRLGGFPSGRGAALVAHDGAKLSLEDAGITTEGFIRPGLTVSDGASASVTDTEITAMGGDPLKEGGEGYVNTPDEDAMISPPWSLGITGGSPAIGLVGSAPSLSLVNSAVSAAGWGVLSASSSRGATVTAVDSQLHILPPEDGGFDAGESILGYEENAYGSGYGSYLADGASQYLYGTSLSGATYGAVLDGAGDVYCGPSDGTVLLYDGARLHGAVQGQGNISSIDSVFGFMTCGEGVQSVTVEGGSVIKTADATVLCKGGDGMFSFDNARLLSGNGVLFQMMDDDADDRIGHTADFNGYTPIYNEADVGGCPGFPLVWPEEEEAAADGGGQDAPADPDAVPPAEAPRHVELSYANGLYVGDIYNGTGYYGQPADSLTLTVGSGAVLSGTVSLSSTVKAIPYSPEAAEALRAREDVKYVFLDVGGGLCGEESAASIQLLRYTINEYFLQGHVRDLPYYNGGASLDVTVAANGAWVVESLSVLTSLTVEDGALVYGEAGDNGDGSITIFPSSELLAPGVYAPGHVSSDTEEEPAPEVTEDEPKEPLDGEPAEDAGEEPEAETNEETELTAPEPTDAPDPVPTEEPAADKKAGPDEEELPDEETTPEEDALSEEEDGVTTGEQEPSDDAS